MGMSARSIQADSTESISSAGDSPARTSVPRASVLASLAIEAASGSSSLASLMAAARSGSSSRTCAAAPANGSTPCDETWDSAAMRRFRSRFRQAISAHPTTAHAFSSWGLLPTATTCNDFPQQSRRDGDGRERHSLQTLLPTLTASGAERGGRGDLLAVIRGRPMKHHRVVLPTLTIKGNYNRAGASEKAGDGLATRIGSGPLNPQFLEWFMGFPDGWTESEPSETRSCPSAPK